MGKFQQVSIALASQWETTPEIIAYIRSCNKNLHLDRQEMIVRQQDKIKQWKRDFSHLPAAVEKRKALAKKYPKDAAKHMMAAKNLQEVIDNNTLGGGKRSDLLIFLQRVTDADFKKVVL